MSPPIEITTTLPSGVIALTLEILALGMGLLVARNLQVIVTLSARRRLLVGGSATLQDVSWGVGILEGISSPRRLLGDWRSMLSFLLMFFVVIFEVLAVLQTQPSEGCDFKKPGSFTVQEKSLGCADGSGDLFWQSADLYLDKARDVLKDVDVDKGVPVNTDVFEQSLLDKTSVEALRHKEKRYFAPLRESWSVEGVFSPLTILDDPVIVGEYACASEIEREDHVLLDVVEALEHYRTVPKHANANPQADASVEDISFPHRGLLSASICQILYGCVCVVMGEYGFRVRWRS